MDVGPPPCISDGLKGAQPFKANTETVRRTATVKINNFFIIVILSY
jgi:hypothetical protein